MQKKQPVLLPRAATRNLVNVLETTEPGLPTKHHSQRPEPSEPRWRVLSHVRREALKLATELIVNN